MAAKESTVPKQHRSGLYLPATCVAALAALGLMFMLTVAKDLQNRRILEAHLADTTRRADTQKLLAPLLAELQGESEASVPSIAVGENTFLPPGDMSADNYETIIEEIVRQCDLKLMSLTPDIESILSDAGTLQVSLEVRGAFPDFRRLMTALAGLPFLAGIENFRVEETADADMLEMILQLQLQLAASAEGTHEPQ